MLERLILSAEQKIMGVVNDAAGFFESTTNRERYDLAHALNITAAPFYYWTVSELHESNAMGFAAAACYTTILTLMTLSMKDYQKKGLAKSQRRISQVLGHVFATKAVMSLDYSSLPLLLTSAACYVLASKPTQFETTTSADEVYS